jgi:hypothetical protein
VVPVFRPGLYGLPGQPNPYLASRQRTEEVRLASSAAPAPGWRRGRGPCTEEAAGLQVGGAAVPFRSRMRPTEEHATAQMADGSWPHGWMAAAKRFAGEPSLLLP